MKRFCFIFVCLFFVTSFIYAQNPDGTNSEWKSFELPNEELSFEMPSSVSSTKSLSNGKDFPVLYSASANRNLFFVTSGKENEISILNEIRELIDSEKAAEESISIGDFAASKYSFADSEDFFQTIVLAKARDKFYIFHGVSEEKDNPDIERFIASIKSNPRFVQTPDSQTAAEKSERIVSNNSAAGNVGRGTGSGNGNGSGSGAATQKTEPSNQNLPLKILYLPKPSYTNLARYYSIKGKVTLRVAFSSDGTIGDLTPVTKLPFGLTNSAKNAAKQIRFQPMTNSGTPQTVVKPVEFSFAIY